MRPSNRWVWPPTSYRAQLCEALPLCVELDQCKSLQAMVGKSKGTVGGVAFHFGQLDPKSLRTPVSLPPTRTAQLHWHVMPIAIFCAPSRNRIENLRSQLSPLPDSFILLQAQNIRPWALTSCTVYPSSSEGRHLSATRMSDAVHLNSGTQCQRRRHSLLRAQEGCKQGRVPAFVPGCSCGHPARKLRQCLESGNGWAHQRGPAIRADVSLAVGSCDHRHFNQHTHCHS